jgi:hypothetical protein
VAAILLGVTIVTTAVAREEADRIAPQPFTATLACTDEAPTFAGEGSEEQLALDLTLMTLATPTWPIAVEASDGRLTGEGTQAVNGDLYWAGPSVADAISSIDVLVATIRFGDDAGSWQGARYFYMTGDEPQFPTDVVVLEGQGAYAGLVALTSMTMGASLCEAELSGAIVQGGLPVIPE